MADKTGNPKPPETDDTPPDFTPEGAEWEPAGGIVRKPPAPRGVEDGKSD